MPNLENQLVISCPVLLVRMGYFRFARDPGTIPSGTAAKDRIALGHYYCFVDVLPVVLSKKLPTASANCCGIVSMALCC